MDLLTRLISRSLPSLTTKPLLRLTDIARFETILEALSQFWEFGTLSVRREGDLLYVTQIEAHSRAPSELTSNVHKRKRAEVDEDTDSTGEQEDPVSHRGNTPALQNGDTGSGLVALSLEMQQVYSVLQRGTARNKLIAEQFASGGGTFEPICPHITKEDCSVSRVALNDVCDRIHFRALIRPHTDISLGHCSYLNTCYSEPTYAQSPSIPPRPSAGGVAASVSIAGALSSNLGSGVTLPSGLGAGGRGKEKMPCRYLHFEVDWNGDELHVNNAAEDWAKRWRTRESTGPSIHKLAIGLGPTGHIGEPHPPQWINCDLRKFDPSVLGKFHCILADPPWDIHMSLPYGTMTDDEMRSMPIPSLQDEGFIFLWVTGRAMEIGRECLRVWGYTRVDEVIWVKTNQLQRVIRTGRTGHWLNHTKEHMLVGLKNKPSEDNVTGPLQWPKWANRGLDTDVIVSEVRETSRKPDEMYGIIERMCPGGRKVEIFGRRHNKRPGWITLGNQLGSDQIHEEDLIERIRARYPERFPEGGAR